jgi:hypothetical protein
MLDVYRHGKAKSWNMIYFRTMLDPFLELWQYTWGILSVNSVSQTQRTSAEDVVRMLRSFSRAVTSTVRELECGRT